MVSCMYYTIYYDIITVKQKNHCGVTVPTIMVVTTIHLCLFAVLYYKSKDNSN